MDAASEQDHHRREAIRRTVRALREHLDLDVAFVSQFVDGNRVFRFVDAEDEESPIEVGGSDPLDESYCHYVVRGQLPEFLRDPNEHPLAATLPATDGLPVGTHYSVPIEFSDGRTYGTFCCFAHDVRADAEPEDVRALRMMASLIAEYLEESDRRSVEQTKRRDLIQDVLADPDGLSIVFQPLVDINSGEIVSLEALSRFTGKNEGPAWFFTEAAEVGLGLELDLKAVGTTLGRFGEIPHPVRLNMNVSPETLMSRSFSEMVCDVPFERLVVEVTEHAAVQDYAALQAASDALTARGVRMSIDDLGAGFSGLSRILETGADELKMDRSIVQSVDADPVKQAMIHALVGFCSRAGFALVAEGVETEAELTMLRSLGVKLAQGYWFARPAPLETFLGARTTTSAA